MLFLEHKQQNEAKKSFQGAVKILEDDNFSKKKEILLSDAYLQLGISLGNGKSKKVWKGVGCGVGVGVGIGVSVSLFSFLLN